MNTTVRWKVKEFLDERGLSAYKLTKRTELSPNAVYGITRGETNQVRLDTLAGLLSGLRDLTGEPVSLEDVLEVVEVPEGLTAAGVPYTGHQETDAILDEQPDIIERIQRLERGEAKLIPWEQVKAEQRAKRNL